MESSDKNGEQTTTVVVTTQVKTQKEPIQRGLAAMEGDHDWSTKLFDCTQDSKVCELMFAIIYIDDSDNIYTLG